MKHIPLEKQSKRAQKEHHDKQRGSWNGVVPVSYTHLDVYKRQIPEDADTGGDADDLCNV